MAHETGLEERSSRNWACMHSLRNFAVREPAQLAIERQQGITSHTHFLILEHWTLEPEGFALRHRLEISALHSLTEVAPKDGLPERAAGRPGSPLARLSGFLGFLELRLASVL